MRRAKSSLHPSTRSTYSGCIFHAPYAEPNWRTTSESWYHVDNPKPRPGSLSGQRVVFPGILNLEAVTAETGGFVCIPKSHKVFSGSAHEGRVKHTLTFVSTTTFLTRNPTNESEINCIHNLSSSAQEDDAVPYSSGTHVSYTVQRQAPCLIRQMLGQKSPSCFVWQHLFPCAPGRGPLGSADRSMRRKLVEQRQCINSHIPYAVATQRQVASAVFYEGVWDDEACMQMIGIEKSEENS